MAAHVPLLPGNATRLERLLSETADPIRTLADLYDGIDTVWRNPTAPFLPFLVWQYGLGELAPYLPNLYELIDEGIRWQRERGTVAAIRRALGWLGYDATIEEEPARRRRWNRFQIALDRVRDADAPDLSRINGVVDLSPPWRSKFYRGFRGHDVRAAECSYRRLSGALLSAHSGVRIEVDRAKWSFGRSHDLVGAFSQADLVALGVWLAPSTTPPGPWTNDTRVWSTIAEPWFSVDAQTRIDLMAGGIVGRTCHVRLSDGAGVIGYRRAILRRVRPAPGGEYSVAGSTYSAAPGVLTAVLARARTDFGDGAGRTATSAALVFDLATVDAVPPGTLWLSPGEVSGGIAVTARTVSIPLGATVRETLSFLLTF